MLLHIKESETKKNDTQKKEKVAKLQNVWYS